MNSIEYFAARFPYMTAPGNHESYTNFTHYRALFNPLNQSLYYSYNLGYAHFIMLDSEAFVGRFHTLKTIDDHLDWLTNDLEKNEQPFIIIVSHRPIYCNPNPICRICTSACTHYGPILANYLENLIKQYNVTLWVSGDVHLYERSLPVFRNETMQVGSDRFENPPAPIYIVNGVAGNFDSADSLSSVAEVRMPWNAVASESLGYGKVIIHNSTHLEWIEYAVGKTQNDDPEFIETAKLRVIDRFWIVKTDN